MVCVVYCLGKWQSRVSTGMFGNLMAIYHIMLQFIQSHSRFVMLMKTCMISWKASTFNALETLCDNVYFCGYPNLLVVTQIYGTIMIRAWVKYVNVFANTNTNTAYMYLYLIQFQTMYLYLYLFHRIWCIWQIHFIPGPFSKHKFMEQKLTWIFLINMLKNVIFFKTNAEV